MSIRTIIILVAMISGSSDRNCIHGLNILPANQLVVIESG